MYQFAQFLILFFAASTFGLEVIQVGRLPFPVKHTSALYDHQDSIIIFSGDIIHHREIFRYNLSNGVLEEFSYFDAPMQSGYGATDGKGKYYYIGGTGGDYTHGIWSLSASNPQPVFRYQLVDSGTIYHSAIASDERGSVYFVRGIYGDLQNIYKYDTDANEVTTAVTLEHISAGAAGAWAADSFWLFSGVSKDYGSYTKDILQFNPATGSVVTHTGVLPIGHTYSTAIVVGEDIYLLGGLTYNEGDHHLTKFNIRTLRAEQIHVEKFPTQFYLAGASYDPKTNRIYVFGGAIYFGEADRIFYIQLDV